MKSDIKYITYLFANLTFHNHKLIFGRDIVVWHFKMKSFTSKYSLHCKLLLWICVFVLSFYDA